MGCLVASVAHLQRGKPTDCYSVKHKFQVDCLPQLGTLGAHWGGGGGGVLLQGSQASRAPSSDKVNKGKTVPVCPCGLRAERPRGRSSSPGRVKNFLFSTSSRLALGPTEPPVERVRSALSPGLGGRGVKLTTHQLVPKSRKCGHIYPLRHKSSWRSA
jgi:hypothetical protein